MNKTSYPSVNNGMNNGCINLSVRQIQILQNCMIGKTVQQLCELTNFSQPTIWRDLRKLIKVELIKNIGERNLGLFQTTLNAKSIIPPLTKQSTDELDPTLKKRSQIIARLHKFLFRTVILKKPERFIRKLRDGPWQENIMRNWTYYSQKAHIDGYQAYMRFTPKKCFIDLEEIHAVDVEDAGQIAFRRAEAIRKQLEEEYPGLELGILQCQLQRPQLHVGIQNSPIAKLFIENKWMQYKTDRLLIDDSKGPELEAHHPIFSEDDGQLIMENYEDMVRRGIRIKDLNKDLTSTVDSLSDMGTIVRELSEKQYEITSKQGSIITGNLSLTSTLAALAGGLQEVTRDLKAFIQYKAPWWKFWKRRNAS